MEDEQKQQGDGVDVEGVEREDAVGRVRADEKCQKASRNARPTSANAIG
ncbi:MAG: hypothetical protein IPI02_06540 [Sterolibacteriaceae bacterium]|nr:hypothetical protein [Sterolibacteriaceae bacterium]